MSAILSKEQLERAAFFAHCKDKEHLKLWIKRYLGLDLPDGIVCDDDTRNDPSNSSPIDLIWEIYEKAIYQVNPEQNRILAFAARSAFKTLSSSVIELLMLFHGRRDVAHLAAEEQQSSRSASNLEGFLSKPILKDFLTSENKRTLAVTWYEDANRSRFFTPLEYSNAKKNGEHWINHAIKQTYSMQILIASIKGTNSAHVPFLCLDELDLVSPKPFAEAMMIPAPSRDGKLPIVFMTSSRKTSIGPVQKQIDEAKETDLLVRHWNYIDITKSCPPERHLPNEPRIPIYFNEDTLRAIGEDGYKQLTEKEKEKWLVETGYAGCLSRCSIFAQCRGRLATKQKSKSNLLTDVTFTAMQFRAFAKDPNTAKAQLLCWRPEMGALIFPHLNKTIHLKTASQIAEIVTGNPHPEIRTRAQLFQLFTSLGARIAAGMDFGFTHNFAVIIAAIYGNKAYIFQAFELAGLEIMEKLSLCETLLRPYNPIIHPDQAYPSDIKTFRKSGYQMTNFKKDVKLGIDSARSKISPTSEDEPEMYFLDDSNEDGRVVTAFTKISRYEYVLDANGKPTEDPKEDDDDSAAAFRYLCQQEFGKALGKSHKPTEYGSAGQRKEAPTPNQQWMSDKVRELLNENGGDVQPVPVRKGKFFSV